jgi:antitoxin Phd
VIPSKSPEKAESAVMISKASYEAYKKAEFEAKFPKQSESY